MFQECNLKLTLILDFHRSSRGENDNSFSIIKPLLGQFGSERVKVFCYKNPLSKKIGKSIQLNPKFNEILGVHHMKYIIFDDDVILTGYI